MLWMFRRVMFGPLTRPENEVLRDLSPREIAVFVPMIVVMFWMGLFPKPFFDVMEKSVAEVLARHEQRLGQAEVPRLEIQAVLDSLAPARKN